MLQPGGHKRLTELDALRGISILLVLVEHSDSFTPWPAFNIHGWSNYQFNTGLVLFFAISGFAMSMAVFSPTYHGLDLGQRLREYFRRRLWRIQPLAFTWIALTLIAAYLGMFVFGWRGYFGNFVMDLRESVYAIVPIANFKSQVAFGGLTVFSVFWTLAIEEQFYIVFPFIVFTAKSRRAAFVRCLIALFACILVIRNPYMGQIVNLSPKWQAALNAPWFQPIFLGVMAYFAADLLKRYLPARLDVAVRIIGILCIAVMPWLDTSSQVWNALGTPVLCAIGVLGSSLSVRGFPWPGTTPLAWIGRRSYGIYLAHLPVSMLNRELWNSYLGWDLGSGNWLTWSLAILTWAMMTMAAVEALYQRVEKPLTEYGRSHRAR